MRTIWIIPLALTVACSHSSEHDHHTHSHGPAEHSHQEHASEMHAEEHREEVHLLDRQMEVMDIRLGHFETLDLSQTIRSNGRLELPPQNRAEVTALWGGRVKEIFVFPGGVLKKGELMATLEQPGFIQLQEDFLRHKAEWRLSQKALERREQLAADSLNSQQSLEQARTHAKNLEVQVKAAEAQLRMMGISPASLEKEGIRSELPIYAPINGHVRSIDIQIGSYVQEHERLFELVDNDHLHIDLLVYEKDVHKVNVGQEVVFHLSGRPDELFRAQVFAVGKSFEEEARALLVHAEIENDAGGLLPGMYVEARIEVGQRKARALPEAAIVRDAGMDYIFVWAQEDASHGEEGEWVFLKQEVKVGIRDLGYAEVVPADPLSDNAEVVTHGAFYLMAELNKGDGEHGHHH